MGALERRRDVVEGRSVSVVSTVLVCLHEVMIIRFQILDVYAKRTGRSAVLVLACMFSCDDFSSLTGPTRTSFCARSIVPSVRPLSLPKEFIVWKLYRSPQLRRRRAMTFILARLWRFQFQLL